MTRLDEIKKRVSKTTVDWSFNHDKAYSPPVFFGETMIALADTYEDWQHDVALVEHSRSDITWLISEIERLTG